MVKVLLGWEQKEILDLLAKMLEINAGDTTMRTAFIEYAKDLNLIGKRRDT